MPLGGKNFTRFRKHKTSLYYIPLQSPSKESLKGPDFLSVGSRSVWVRLFSQVIQLCQLWFNAGEDSALP